MCFRGQRRDFGNAVGSVTVLKCRESLGPDSAVLEERPRLRTVALSSRGHCVWRRSTAFDYELDLGCLRVAKSVARNACHRDSRHHRYTSQFWPNGLRASQSRHRTPLDFRVARDVTQTKMPLCSSRRFNRLAVDLAEPATASPGADVYGAAQAPELSTLGLHPTETLC
jgi:hypothetical protein